MLSKIPVHGCLVYDKTQDQVLFISGYVMRCNPNGYRNCIGATIPGIDGIVPVFTWAAEAGAAYDNSDTDSQLAKGVIGSWTPYKAIKYACALANIKAGSVLGTPQSKWRSLATATRLQWPMKNNELLTMDSSGEPEMYKKLPDHVFQGKTMLGFMTEIMRMAPAFNFYAGI